MARSKKKNEAKARAKGKGGKGGEGKGGKGGKGGRGAHSGGAVAKADTVAEVVVKLCCETSSLLLSL